MKQMEKGTGTKGTFYIQDTAPKCTLLMNIYSKHYKIPDDYRPL